MTLLKLWLAKKAVVAFTIAVEKVIDVHYAEQAENLSNNYKELKSTLMKFTDDYLGHIES